MADQQTNNIKRGNLSEQQLKFIDWLVTPKTRRTPKTQGQLADRLGLAETTLSRWKDYPEFCQALRQAIEAAAGGDDADIIEALKASAKLKGPKGAGDRRTYLQWRGWLVQKQEISGAGGEPLRIEIIHADSPAPGPESITAGH